VKRLIVIIVLALTVSYGSAVTVHGGNVPAPPSAAPQILPPEIVPQPDGSCLVYPVGDSTKTEIHPLFGTYTGPAGYRVTKDLANVQIAVMNFPYVTLKATNLVGDPKAFHFGAVDFASAQPSSNGLPGISVMITKDVTVEGEVNSPFGRATIVGGSLCFGIFPNQALYYDVGTFRMRPKPGTGRIQCYWPIPGQATLPDVTIQHLDSEQASLDFIILKAARNAVINDVRVTNMTSPWEIFAPSPLAGKWLFPIEIVPGAVLVYGPEYIENVLVSNCQLSPRPTSNLEIGILVESSAGTLTFRDDEIEVSYAGIVLLNSPTAVTTIENNQINLTASAAPGAPGVQSCGIGLIVASNSTVMNNEIRGVGINGISLLGTSNFNTFENIDMREFDALSRYVLCDKSVLDPTNNAPSYNTGTNIGVPAGSCGRYIQDTGTNNTFNRLPEIIPIAPQVAYVGSLFELQVLTTHESYESYESYDVLTYGAAAAQWLSINPASGKMSGTPTAPGKNDVAVTVTDNKCGMSSSSFVIDVRCPPIVVTSLAASPNLLWPPNHKVVPVALSATTSGGCGRVSCQIVGVSSNEPASADGDWQITGPLTLLLRAERLGAGDGRVYTITVQCTDEKGNTASRTVTVTVPHDQGK